MVMQGRVVTDLRSCSGWVTTDYVDMGITDMQWKEVKESCMVTHVLVTYKLLLFL